MFQFQHLAPLDLTEYGTVDASDRSGPPLSQGFVLLLISTIAAEHCRPATLDALAGVSPEGWYHGQALATVIDELAEQDAELPFDVGKNIYYTLRSQFLSLGIRTPEDVITTLPGLWMHVTRGDSGEWRTAIVGKQHARLELEQPYNCQFEQGAVHGALEAFDAQDVQIDHSQCIRDGAPFCVFDVRWQNGQ